MRLQELFSLDEDLPSSFVNQQIDKKSWKELGSGVTASVWQHIADPDTVVKVVGGGDDWSTDKHTKSASIAFVDFLVHHGHKSPHFPIVHGINLDDPEVVQIRIERLQELPNVKGIMLGDALALIAAYANNPDAYFHLFKADQIQSQLSKLNKLNTIRGLMEAVTLLKRAMPIYKKKYKIQKLNMDLHYGNWLIRPNGVIVAADPWYGYWV